LQDTASSNADFQTYYNSATDNGPMSSFTVNFGVNFGNFPSGGGTRLFGIRTKEPGSTTHGKFDWGSQGWYVSINSNGQAAGTTIDFLTDFNGSVFTTDQHNWVAHSTPIPFAQGLLWNQVSIAVTTIDSATVNVTFTITGPAPLATITSSSTLPRPTVTAKAKFTYGSKYDDVQPRYVDIDGIEILGVGNSPIARYDFESGTLGARIDTVPDIDGGTTVHTLQSNDTSTRFASVAQNGVDPTLATNLKNFVIDNETNPSRPTQPKVLTNWGLSDAPGRFLAWQSKGFTHSDISYYAATNILPYFSNINDVLRTDQLRREDAVGVPAWRHVWWGNYAHPCSPLSDSTCDQWDDTAHTGTKNLATVMTAAQHQTAMTLAVLDGNRWFSVFTGMSNGTLAAAPGVGYRSTDATYNSTVAPALASANADDLYAMAQTASWFQSTSTSLANSVVVSPATLATQGVPSDLLPYSRARKSGTEFWFAGFSPAASNRTITLTNLPVTTGTARNLATLVDTPVSGGQVTLTLTQDAQPYYIF
jgi:hypothetical protein